LPQESIAKQYQPHSKVGRAKAEVRNFEVIAAGRQQFVIKRIEVIVKGVGLLYKVF